MRAILPMLLLAVLGTGCGPDCESSCEKLFGDGPDECNIQVAGHSGATGRSYMIAQCMNHCQAAMERNGEVGDYDPNVRPQGNNEVSLENEKQAALWMDCVAETSCENLGTNGYCQPTTNFP
jgi:hypothetical protein